MKPITMIVPYPPGGANDILARRVGEKLGQALGQPVVVENRAGAGGTIGTGAAAKAPADGYTLLVINTIPHAASRALYKKLSFDPIKDFEPVGVIAMTPYVLVTAENSSYKTFADFTKAAKSQPGKLTYASGGQGGATHLAAELLSRATNVRLSHIPYRGGGPALTDVMGGQVDVTFENIVAVRPFLSSGKLRPLGVSSSEPSSMLPGVPTVASQVGAPFEILGRFAVVAPVGTPKPVIKRLNQEVTAIVRSSEVSTYFRQQGIEPAWSTPEELGSILRAESTKWSQLVKEKGISLD
ncbi:tripartite tricarboxylate transporter substrate binding protein [Cupriavidus sp. AcVe19-1a]|uniref:Bug family tripartite tricarboxylate transporter substrate binding protein n=1 Tax=Cupriavidus sp. AcVe19-1a TaxID=2821359 RepID=UPI001AEAE635|nr:tripartite tricarboxylate transporter substrate binding protein [Cupriavidus sp. AcVe19-1a]MBP0633085.1 tripartite tricarboxylate transporter substrate binding protein [Cupriavidus sp. AcVe19-1a]